MSEKAGVVVLMTRGEDKIYLSRRINCRGFNGLMQGCGGRVEDEETPLQAACRELKEEAGLDIWEVRIHSIGCDPTQRNSADQAFELHVFRVELLDGETPKQMEPDMHGPWEEFTFKDMYERSDLMPGLYSFMVRNELLAEWGSPTFRTIHEAAAQLAALYDLYAPIGILVKPQAQWDEMDFLEYVRWSAVRRVVRRLPKWVLAPISYDVRKRGLKMVVLVRAELLGGHVHANVFTGRMVGNLSKSGSLVFREAEYPEFVTGLAARRSEEFEVFFEGHLAPEKRAV